MAITLTEPRRQTLRAIFELTQARGYAPTVRDLCRHFGLKSTSPMQARVNALISLGYLLREPGMARSLRVTASGMQQLTMMGVGVPAPEAVAS